MRLEKVIAISIVFACGASCADDDFDDDDNDVNDVTATVDGVYVVDGTDAANWDAASTYAATDALDDPFVLAARTGEGGARNASGFDPEHAAAVAAESAGNYFSPASCVTATADGGEVTYELSSCSGPLGLLRTSGMIMVAFSDSSTGDEDAAVPDQVDAGAGSAVLVVDVSSHDLTINSAAATLDAHGTYARDDASGDKVLTLHSKGKHARNGVSVLRDVNATIRWKAGSQCANVDADGTLKTNGTSLDVVVEGFTRCRGECPTAGTVRIVNDRTVTLTLDGTDQPEFTSSSGSRGSIALDCQ